MSERRACAVVGQPRSAQRLAPPIPTDDELALRAWLRDFARKRPWTGMATNSPGHAPGGAATPQVLQAVGDDWTELEIGPSGILQLATFSQGEILEFSREPVGRMSLVDQALDFGELDSQEAAVLAQLRSNAKALRTWRRSCRS